MDDFKFVYLNKDDMWPDHLICKHCGNRVERGIANISNHWLNCLDRKEGLIIINKVN